VVIAAHTEALASAETAAGIVIGATAGTGGTAAVAAAADASGRGKLDVLAARQAQSEADQELQA
jgi:hypothetical protein